MFIVCFNTFSIPIIFNPLDNIHQTTMLHQTIQVNIKENTIWVVLD